MDKRKEYIACMFAAFGQASDGTRMAVYYKMLKDVPADMVSAICDKAMMECKFLPSIAELRSMGESLIGEASGNRVKTWQEAQREIQKGITMTWYHGCLGEPVSDELYGKPCEPKWSTEEIRQAVDSYGLDNINRANESDMPIVWSQLRKIYEQACERKRDKEVNSYVLGGGNDFKLITDKVSKSIGGM